MIVLNKSIDDITFQDVVDFCQMQIPEGTQIDYKKQPPEKGFSKHIAAFSNTRGGIIIVGIEEEQKTGIPISWKGIDKDAKLVERIYQEISNVKPLPNCRVRYTDEVDGKTFLLVRIYEGSKTPYYVDNDPNVWVRTGNIRQALDIGEPDWVELLFNKRDRARRAREVYIKNAKLVFQHALKNEETKRLTELKHAEENSSSRANLISKEILGKDTSIATFTIQPYFPHIALEKPNILKNLINNLQISTGFNTFPALNMISMQNGLYYFEPNDSLTCQQIYSQGLIYYSIDARSQFKGKNCIYLLHILAYTFTLLKFARKFFKQLNYQGILKGEISINHLEDVQFVNFDTRNAWIYNGYKDSLLPNYSTLFELDTNKLNNNEGLLQTFYELMSTLNWDLGFSHLDQKTFESLLQQNKLSFE